jgi:broad specificity phosphatase PhoE
MDKTIYMVRHGNTLSNTKKIYSGASMEKLTPEGVDQVKALFEKIRNCSIKKIYSSPIERSLQTAKIIKEFIQGKLVVEPDLKEIVMGPWEGLSEHEVGKQYPDEYRTWLENPPALRIEGREFLEDLQTRAFGAFTRILFEDPHEGALLVTHVSVMRSILLRLYNLPLDLYKTIQIPNACTYKVTLRHNNIMTRRIN